MAKDNDKGSGGTPGDNDTAGLKSALEKALTAQKEAENQVKQLRVEMAQVKKEDDASKSELEKLAERVKAAEEKQAEADARALRAEVAAEKKLTPAQAKRLSGSTREELESDADDLLEAFGVKNDDSDAGGEKNGDSGGDKGRGRPKEKLRGGASGDADADGEGKSPEEIAEEVWKSTRGGI